MTFPISLRGCTLLDIYGLQRTEHAGTFDEVSLADLLIDEWVPFLECHKCSRSDYCRFAEPRAPGNERKREIQCGVVVASIRNFVRVTFPQLLSLSKKQLQQYLDGAYHFSRFLFLAEIKIGSSMDADYIDSLSDWATHFFGGFVHLREHLNGMAGSFKGLPNLDSKKGFLLVEGPSERAFIERLRLSHSGWFLDLEIDTYSGKGSRGAKRLEKFIRHLINRGYEVYIEGDADGGSLNIFDHLVKRGLIDGGCTFVFSSDFETAVPDHLAYAALKHINLIDDIALQDYCERMLSQAGSFSQKLRSSFSINIHESKVEFGEAVADVINWARDWIWHQDNEFLNTELGRFLIFLRQIY